MFQKRHVKAIAHLLKLQFAFRKQRGEEEKWYAVYAIMLDFTVLFEDSNSRFDREAFRKMCGLTA